jgi:P27 family predicted phage terminase small subunit
MFKDKEPPVNLGPTGQAEWGRMMQLLGDVGFSSDLDRQTLFSYCEAFQEYDDLVAKVAKTGPLVRTEKGNWIQSPLLCAKNKAGDRMLKISKEFGLTPWSRSRMDCLEKQAEDAFASFLADG